MIHEIINTGMAIQCVLEVDTICYIRRLTDLLSKDILTPPPHSITAITSYGLPSRALLLQQQMTIARLPSVTADQRFLR